MPPVIIDRFCIRQQLVRAHKPEGLRIGAKSTQARIDARRDFEYFTTQLLLFISRVLRRLYTSYNLYPCQHLRFSVSKWFSSCRVPASFFTAYRKVAATDLSPPHSPVPEFSVETIGQANVCSSSRGVKDWWSEGLGSGFCGHTRVTRLGRRHWHPRGAAHNCCDLAPVGGRHLQAARGAPALELRGSCTAVRKIPHTARRRSGAM